MRLPGAQRALSGLAVAAVIATAAGCGSSKPDAASNGKAPDVASLVTASGAPPSGPAVEAQRPRYRIDMTNEERDALSAPRKKCLVENGDTRHVDKRIEVPKQVTDAAEKA